MAFGCSKHAVYLPHMKKTSKQWNCRNECHNVTLFSNVQTKGHERVTFKYFSKWSYPYRWSLCLPICHTGDKYTVVDVFRLSLLAFGVILLPKKRSYLGYKETKHLEEYLGCYLLNPKPKRVWVLQGRFLLGFIFLLKRIYGLHLYFFLCVCI